MNTKTSTNTMLAPQWWWMQKQITSTNTTLTPQHGDEHRNKQVLPPTTVDLSYNPELNKTSNYQSDMRPLWHKTAVGCSQTHLQHLTARCYTGSHTIKNSFPTAGWIISSPSKQKIKKQKCYISLKSKGVTDFKTMELCSTVTINVWLQFESTNATSQSVCHSLDCQLFPMVENCFLLVNSHSLKGPGWL